LTARRSEWYVYCPEKQIPIHHHEEHCPIPQKAIRPHPVKVINPGKWEIVVAQPYVVEELCNRCGCICEKRLPTGGKGGDQSLRAQRLDNAAGDFRPVG
jgi:hypothetical protein